MTHIFEDNKAIVIFGPQGSGKGIIAKALAKACGMSHIRTTEYAIKNPLDYGNILTYEPKTVIVDEFSDFEWAKNLITNDKIKVSRGKREPKFIDTPRFIFISNDITPPDFRGDSRRFTFIEINPTP